MLKSQDTASQSEDLEPCVLGVKACMCQRHKPKPVRRLTELILACWQREYDKRPYENLILNGTIYRSKMFRNMTEHDYQVLFDFLKMRKIRFLEISYMPIPDKNSLTEQLAQCIFRIDKVSLMGINVPVRLLEILAEQGEAVKIKMLRLAGNELTMEHAKHLRCFLIHSKELLYLDVGECDLDENTFAMVADGVDESKSLKALNMSRIVNRSRVSCVDENKLSSVMAILIWRSPLVEIHFKKCGLDSTAIKPLLEYISRNKSLLFLDLGSNKIEGVGASELLAAIKKQDCLVGLDISNNRLGEYGGEVVAHQLPETKLKYLDIGRNNIPAESIYLILSTLKKSYNTCVLNIVGNRTDGSVGATLSRQLATKVLFLDSVDASVTYDMDKKELRVVPNSNSVGKWNERYFRAGHLFPWPSPFFVVIDNVVDFQLEKEGEEPNILINELTAGPFIVNQAGKFIWKQEYASCVLNDCCDIINRGIK